jgi:Spy/CpxP family protein refolding chaperone
MTMLAQSDTQAAQPQGQTGEQHGHMRHGGMMNPQAQLDHLSQQLNLTDDQKAKILPILQNTDTQAQSVRQDTSLSQQDRREKMRSLHESAMTQVRAVLTPDQQAKLDSLKKSHEGKGMGHGHGTGAGNGSQQQGPPQQ